MLQRLRRLAPDALFVSARTGAGLDELRTRIDGRLPRPDVEITVLVPYPRGDLVARVHESGEVLASRAHRRRDADQRSGQPRVGRCTAGLRRHASEYRKAGTDRHRRASGRLTHGACSPRGISSRCSSSPDCCSSAGSSCLTWRARVGRSLRIFKTEMKGMTEDDKARAQAAAPPPPVLTPPPAVAPPLPPAARPAAGSRRSAELTAEQRRHQHCRDSRRAGAAEP